MTNEEFKELVLSFPGVSHQPHFERIAFKVDGKRIFATLLEEDQAVNIKLSKSDQEQFSSLDDAIFPVANKWGLQGWTTFRIARLDKDIVLTALQGAYDEVFKNKSTK